MASSAPRVTLQPVAPPRTHSPPESWPARQTSALGAGDAVAPAELQVIGYLEQVSLPRWGLGVVTAKMDTGADTSALHVEELTPVGSTRVAFEVADEAEGGQSRRVVQAKIERRGVVRSSNGDEEARIFVRAAVTLCGVTRIVELGLVDRSRMQQRMLLGRSALQGVYLVDPARAYLSSPRHCPGSERETG